MKCFKSCVSTSTDESRFLKSNALDPFEDVEPSSKACCDKNGREVPRVLAEDLLNHNGNHTPYSLYKIYARNCEEEVIEPLVGVLTGSIPKWLKGTLLRNGLGNFKVGEYSYQHVFDSAALVHRFRIENGQVTYQRRFVQTDTYKKNRVAQRIVVTEFGTKAMPDPCQSIFHRVSSVFHRNEEKTDNTNVSVYPFGDEYYTLTEVPMMHRIDPNTLQTMDKVNLTNYVNIVHHTAHPHVVSDGTVYNIGMSIENQGPQYNVVCFHPRRVITDIIGNRKELSMFDQATIVASVPCRWKLNPSYMHSFGITDNYFIIVEQPLTISVTKRLITQVTHEPIIKCLKWRKNKSTLIHVISRSTGRKIRTFVSETFFFFHMINQFETRDKQYVVLDVCCYRDAKLIEYLYIESMKDVSKIPNYEKLLFSKPLRFVLPMKRPRTDTTPDCDLITIETVHQSLAEQPDSNVHEQRVDHNTNEAKRKTDLNAKDENILLRKSTAYRLPDGNVFVKPELLCNSLCELPRINGSHLGKEYRYFYAISQDTSTNNSAIIIKVDTFQKTVKSWQERNIFIGEPIFVADPDGKNEDDGVVLSLLLWLENYDNRVGLLVLDAATFTEIARVTFDTPGPTPRCLHGWFTLDK
ncbi:carotenoid isomerooxygenase-like [Odontomachus brunneus]|uniref:carotenoid isomerooxygenase-like n=1 Tax=Odontomachus brunneus TaxID=486640 RepID=UPI0013F2A3B7|nr:carotenoid isomerooxygenase-like [Odontomachus brunneus]